MKSLKEINIEVEDDVSDKKLNFKEMLNKKNLSSFELDLIMNDNEGG